MSEANDIQTTPIYLTLALFLIAIICATVICIVLLKNLIDDWQLVVVAGISLISLLMFLFLWLRFVKEVVFVNAKKVKTEIEPLKKEMGEIKTTLESIKKIIPQT